MKLLKLALIALQKLDTNDRYKWIDLDSIPAPKDSKSNKQYIKGKMILYYNIYKSCI